MPETLIIAVTKNDSRIGKTVFGVVNGLENTMFKLFWKDDNLGMFDGGGQQPLTLIGHANVSNFIKEYGGGAAYSTYISGDAVADALIHRNLQVHTFRFCLIAGCCAAESSGRSGLYINIGDTLRIPVVASTTPVKLSGKGMYLQMTPEGDGVWKVYFPDEQGVQPLNSPRCSEIKTILDSYILRI